MLTRRKRTQEGAGGEGAAGRKVNEGERGTEEERDGGICRDGRGGGGLESQGWRRRRVQGRGGRCGVGGRRVAAEKRQPGALGRKLASRTPSPDGLPLGKISEPL